MQDWQKPKRRKVIKELVEGCIGIGMSFTGAWLGANADSLIGVWYAFFSFGMAVFGVIELVNCVNDYNELQ